MTKLEGLAAGQRKLEMVLALVMEKERKGRKERKTKRKSARRNHGTNACSASCGNRWLRTPPISRADPSASMSNSHGTQHGPLVSTTNLKS